MYLAIDESGRIAAEITDPSNIRMTIVEKPVGFDFNKSRNYKYDPVTKVIVPNVKEVTMKQARLVLLRHGMLSNVTAALNAISDPAVKEAALIEWEYSNTVSRDSQLVQQMKAILSITDEQLDGLFLEAVDI